ncbi:hypothetical protein D3Z63_18975 [Vibrio parahaemolyticus]|nr:hypothetical protein RK51_003800 [Vibrio parahaemolyticus]QGG32339.1 hypothetical protein GH799_04135 [Vibrio parahaemolyticus 10329]EGQ8229130.1 hypothetical protein [Vibrio parahaemolyticus]EGQ8238199.1 hypothetical protein [Vibrio parahaemolyticus]EGQ8377557.1 hypothetical protein [Vibrio parahaemolyticus]
MLRDENQTISADATASAFLYLILSKIEGC